LIIQIDYSFIAEIKFSTCGDLALQGKIRMFKFIKSEYLEIANQMRAYRKNNKKDYIFEKYSRNRRISS
jgi:hypothetical protein